MNNYIPFILFILFLQSCSSSSSIIEFDEYPTMLISGKGPGQDGAINPYLGQKCISIVKNIGFRPISVRIQRDGQLVSETELKSKEKKEFILEADYRLYLDAEIPGKAKINFKEYK